MKSIRALPEILVASVKTIFRTEGPEVQSDENPQSRGQGLLKLHEYQHKVIVEVFKISIAGFLAFSFVLTGFSIYLLGDKGSPFWMGLLVLVFGVLLLGALFRTLQEFRKYKKVYADVTAKLQVKLSRGTQRLPFRQDEATARPLENKLLSSLKPKEYKGWDKKQCTNCHKTIEMLSRICQHCGTEQVNLLSV
ncbi:MAG: hypothetical protein OEZ59_00445 [Deltaproteobacteria bacterium]|nr:hypothetical protein [Deltaproteobacteria bacterium]